MKKKLLVTAIVFTAVTSTFAATGKGYREYGEEIHSAPGFNFHVEEVPVGTTMAQKKSLLGGKTTTSVPSRIGRINQGIVVDGYHGFTINNNTDQRQTYEIYVSLVCDKLHSSYRRYVDVNAGGNYTRDDHTSGIVLESYPGKYRIEAESRIKGESSDFSQGSSYLFVSR